MQGAGAAGHRCDRPRGRRCVLQQAREGGHRAESHRRRRRARHAADQVRGRDHRRLCARLGRSQIGFRQRRSLCRAAGRPRAPHRGADRRRRQGRHRGPGRARMHPAAAQPEDRRAGAQPQPQAGAAQEDRRCRRRHGQGREVPQPRHLRVSGGRGGLLLHRGQSAPAGRAHGHRGGVGRRSGEGAAAAGGRREPGQGRPRRRRAARPCDPAPGQHGDHDGGRFGQAGRRHAHGVRAALGPGRAGRHLRLCRLSHQSQFRFAAGQGDRAQPVGRFRRRARARRARARRLPAGRCAQQHRLPARPAGAWRFPRRQGPYALRRRACREASGRGGQAAVRPLFPGRGGTADRRRAAGRRAGRCRRSAGGAGVRQDDLPGDLRG